jgi:hypothetical protein
MDELNLGTLQSGEFFGEKTFSFFTPCCTENSNIYQARLRTNIGRVGKKGRVSAGELSLLPLAGGWRHHRTTTATSNSMLYYL